MRQAMLCVFLLALGLSGCERTTADAARPEAKIPQSQPVATSQPLKTAFDRQLLEAAARHSHWELVGGRVGWASQDCTPSAVNPMSAAAEGTPHARKLYTLHAAFADDYRAAPDKPSRVGQVVVKKTWRPESVEEREAHLADWSDDRRYAEDVDGRVVTVGEQTELFIMLRLDSDTPDTDDGWVYGIVTPEGDRVIRAGRLADCMKCHVPQEHRLFGPQQVELSYDNLFPVETPRGPGAGAPG